MAESFLVAPVSLSGPSVRTMLVLSRRQRELLADKLLDAANLAAGGLVFGQFVTGSSFSVPVARLGVVSWGALTVAGIRLAGGKTS